MKKLIYLLLCCLIACNSEPENLVLQSKLETLMLSMKTHPRDTIFFNMKDITDFQWDNLYVFSYLAKEKQISKKLGFQWHGPTYSSQNSLMFIFTKGHQNDKKVVSYVAFDGHYTEWAKKLYLLSHLSYKSNEFTPETASFRIEQMFDSGYVMADIYSVNAIEETTWKSGISRTNY